MLKSGKVGLNYYLFNEADAILKCQVPSHLYGPDFDGVVYYDHCSVCLYCFMMSSTRVGGRSG